MLGSMERLTTFWSMVKGKSRNSILSSKYLAKGKAYEQGKKMRQYCLFKFMDHCFPRGSNSKTEDMLSFEMAV